MSGLDSTLPEPKSLKSFDDEHAPDWPADRMITYRAPNIPPQEPRPDFDQQINLTVAVSLKQPDYPLPRTSHCLHH